MAAGSTRAMNRATRVAPRPGRRPRGRAGGCGRRRDAARRRDQGLRLPLPKTGSLPTVRERLRPRLDKKITYTRDVAPILWKNCVICHRPGEVGPFSLLTYRDAAKRADFLREITASRRMPPWKPQPGLWGLPRQPPPDRPRARDPGPLGRGRRPGRGPGRLAPPPQFADGWQLGPPDYVFQVAEPFTVPASGEDVFRSFVIPLPLDRDQQVVAFEFRPGNRRVVHHSKLFVVPTDVCAGRDAADPGPGFASTRRRGPRRARALGVDPGHDPRGAGPPASASGSSRGRTSSCSSTTTPAASPRPTGRASAST